MSGGEKKAMQILFKHDIFTVGGGAGRGLTSCKFTVGSSLESSPFAQSVVH